MEAKLQAYKKGGITMPEIEVMPISGPDVTGALEFIEDLRRQICEATRLTPEQRRSFLN